MRSALVLVAILSISVSGQTARLNVAVNELAGKGMDQSTAGIISDRLRSELINTRVFRVMERSEMESILREQGFQQSGACDDSRCMVEAGQLLGVERMVAGSVGKVEDLYTLSLRMIDVRSGEVLYTVNEDFTGTVKQLLAEGVRRAALQLARNAGAELARKSMAGKTGDLHITSSQPGASVLIDGAEAQGQTPLTIQGVAAGEHTIAVRKQTWYGTRRVMLEPGALLKVDLAMQQGTGALKVFTTPPGAQVSIDGAKAGVSPVALTTVAAGGRLVGVIRDEYLPAETTVVIGVNQTLSLAFTLRPAAYLRLSTKEAGADVRVNGVAVARGFRDSAFAVAPGLVAVDAEAAGCMPFTARIELAAGQRKSLDLTLAHTKAWEDSVAAGKGRTTSRRQWLRRILSGTVMVGCGVMGMVANAQISDATAGQDNLYSEYQSAVTDFETYKKKYSALEKDIDTYAALRTVGYAGAGIGGVGLIISIPF